MLGYLLDRALVPASPDVLSAAPSVVFDLGGDAGRETRAARWPGPVPWIAGHSPKGPLRTIPVRLPEPLHERLKAWSEEHNFPMAVVVRGLIERFLDDQTEG